MFRVKMRIMVRVRLKVLLTRLTLGVVHAFVREWLASIRLRVLAYGNDTVVSAYIIRRGCPSPSSDIKRRLGNMRELLERNMGV